MKVFCGLMSPGKLIAGFIVRFLLLYALLMVPWPGLGAAYRAGFVSAGDWMVASFRARGRVRLKAEDGEKGGATLYVPRAEGMMRVKIHTRRFGYLPTAALTSLILATPISWRRRGRALFWGLLLVNAWNALRLPLVVIYGRTRAWSELASGELTLWQQATLAVIESTVGQGVSYIVPILIWIAVTMRRADLARILRAG